MTLSRWPNQWTFKSVWRNILGKFTCKLIMQSARCHSKTNPNKSKTKKHQLRQQSSLFVKSPLFCFFNLILTHLLSVHGSFELFYLTPHVLVILRLPVFLGTHRCNYWVFKLVRQSSEWCAFLRPQQEILAAVSHLPCFNNDPSRLTMNRTCQLFCFLLLYSVMLSIPL